MAPPAGLGFGPDTLSLVNGLAALFGPKAARRGEAPTLSTVRRFNPVRLEEMGLMANGFDLPPPRPTVKHCGKDRSTSSAPSTNLHSSRPGRVGTRGFSCRAGIAPDVA